MEESTFLKLGNINFKIATISVIYNPLLIVGKYVRNLLR